MSYLTLNVHAFFISCTFLASIFIKTRIYTFLVDISSCVALCKIMACDNLLDIVIQV